jgi:Holliday junction resolvase RusA-like endonuclease
MRVKNSFGQFHVNEGTALDISCERYMIDYSRRFYLFDVIPFGAVRMTQSDRWKTNPNHLDPNKRQRKAVTQYFNFKNILVLQANLMRFELGKCFDGVFLIPMPDSWSAKKKERMNGMPCEVKPDTDNITKAIKDALRKNDSDIWYEKAEKRWAYKGSIIIYQ